MAAVAAISTRRRILSGSGLRGETNRTVLLDGGGSLDTRERSMSGELGQIRLEKGRPMSEVRMALLPTGISCSSAPHRDHRSMGTPIGGPFQLTYHLRCLNTFCLGYAHAARIGCGCKRIAYEVSRHLEIAPDSTWWCHFPTLQGYVQSGLCLSAGAFSGTCIPVHAVCCRSLYRFQLRLGLT